MKDRADCYFFMDSLFVITFNSSTDFLLSSTADNLDMIQSCPLPKVHQDWSRNLNRSAHIGLMISLPQFVGLYAAEALIK